MKKILSLLLTLIFVLGVVACADPSVDQGKSTGDSTTTSNDETSGVVTDKVDDLANYRTDMPSDVKFDGETIRFIAASQNSGTLILSDEADKEEIVNAAIYDRNLAIEDQLGVTLEMKMSRSWDQGLHNIISNSLSSYEDEYDVISGYGCVNIVLAAELWLRDLAKMNYIDLEKGYWGGGLTENLAYDGQYFWASGDFSYQYITTLFCTFVSNTVWNDFVAPTEKRTIYQIVDAGEWTYDEMVRLSSLAYRDVDKDEEDTFGFIANFGMADALLFGMGASFSRTTNDGSVELTFGSEKMLDVYDKIYALFNMDSSFVKDGDGDLFKIFTENRALFFQAQLAWAMDTLFREMEPDNAYAIIPLPKYDENQTEYLTSNFNGTALIGVPITTADERVDAIAATLELMSAYGYEKVYPAFYEKAMKYKYSRDDDSARMLDLIRESVATDFVYMWGIYMGDPRIDDFVPMALRKNQKTIASDVATVMDVYKTQLATRLLELEAFE